MLFEDRGTAGSGALVTAYGANNVYCKPSGWGTSSEQGGGVNLNVSCFAAGGSLASSQFEAQFMTPE